MSILSLTCHRCGAEYGYIGEGPHPARCPACGSPCVAPAGGLDVQDRSTWESANGLSKVWIRAVDERERPFEFEFAAHRSRGKLVELKADGISIDPASDETLEEIPSVVRSELVDLGVTELDPATVPRSG
jgi:ribosomal protein S27E